MCLINNDAPRLLVACEQSQVVCAAFRRSGYIAYSCDLLPSYGGHPEWHIIGDAAQVVQGNGTFNLENGAQLLIDKNWDMIIAHPPCTMLTHSSAVARSKGLHSDSDIRAACKFFLKMLNAPSDLVAVENPAPMKDLRLPKYNQIIQPYDFGHKFSKRVCLWLRGLPPLLPTHAQHLDHVQWLKHCAGNPRRRSKTFEGIADAMAAQWGEYLMK